MAFQLFQLPKSVNISSNLTLLAGAKALFQLSNTTTNTPVYQDSALTTPHPNPVVADSAGVFPPIYMNPAIIYRVTLKTSADVTLYSADPVNDQLLSQSIIGGLLYPSTSAEIAASVTPTNYYYPPYNLLRYGADSTGVAASDSAISSWRLACDQADSEGVIPEGSFKITGDVMLPGKVKCCGRITGAFNVIYSGRIQGNYIYRLFCEKFWLRGCTNVAVHNLTCTTSAIVDGLDNSHGTFWGSFVNWVTPSLTLDCSQFAVNQNTWTGGLIRYLHLTGTAPTGANHINANLWDGVDFSNASLGSYGILQDDVLRYRNTLRNCYYENGSQVNGNFHVIGFFAEAFQPPIVDRFCHVIGSTSINIRTSQEYQSLQTHNLARGGQWEWLDFSGKPPCLSAVACSSVSVATDTTAPLGIGKVFQATADGASAQFQIVAQPANVDRVAFVVFYQSTSNFLQGDINGTAIGVEPAINGPGLGTGNWKMLRVAGPANATTPTTLSLFAQGGVPVGAPVFKIGAIFAGAEGAITHPNRNDEFFSDVDTSIGSATNNLRMSVGQFVQQQGAVVVSSAATNPRDVTVTFPWTWAIQPSIQVEMEDDGSGNCANVTSAYILSRSTTQFVYRVNHTGNFSGTLHWRAGGNRV